MGFVCAICGQEHLPLPMDIDVMHPADYYIVPAQEREARVLFSHDHCMIDKRMFIIRGNLCLPVKEIGGDLCWGVWARVSESDFKRYIKWYFKRYDELGNMSDTSKKFHFYGVLSGVVPRFPDTDLLPVEIILRSGDLRPVFMVRDQEHPLAKMQDEGVTLKYVHDLVMGSQRNSTIRLN